MRVLHVMSCRGWSSDAYWAARAAVELERAGHEVTLCCRRGTEARVIARARAAGVRRVETLALVGGFHPADDAADVRRLRAWLPGFDAVHVHRGKEHWLVAAANRLAPARRPLIRTRHIVQAVRPHRLNRWLYGQATDRVVAVTEAIRRQLVGAGLVAESRAVALPGGVDLEAFRGAPAPEAARAALGLHAATPVPEGAPWIGVVAGFRAMKGHAIVLDAVARLRAAGRQLILVLAGQGGHEASVHEQARARGLGDRVVFPGTVADVAALMAALDVALYVPLESDGMSRVLFEYLAAGRPVVASRVGAACELLRDGEHARLVPAGDAAALAAAIGALLDDPALARRLASTGRALVESRLSGACVARRLADLYTEIAAR